MNADNALLESRIARLVHRANEHLGQSEAERVARAIDLMVAVHKHQAPRADGPYLNHTVMVCERVLEWCPAAPGAVWCAALLHDAAEDGAGTLIAALGRSELDTREGRLAAVGTSFGHDVQRRLELLTNPDLQALAVEALGVDADPVELSARRNELYAEHVRHAVHADPWVAAVKLADWSTNGLALDRLTTARREHLTRKYQPIAAIFITLLSGVGPVHPLSTVAPVLLQRVRAAWP